MSEAAEKAGKPPYLAYGLGGLPIGVIQNGIAFFLLIFYDQVVGLDPTLTALALSIALLSDAVTDPLVGYLSDNTRSPLGRRHPYIYLAILPTAGFFYFVWHPPVDASETYLFWHLLATTIGLRTSVTLFDVPHNALVAELSRGYHERTNLASSKVAMLQTAGYIMVIAMYAIWLVPTETYPEGILNREGYQSAAYVGSILILLSMGLSAVSVHRKAVQLKDFAHEGVLSFGALISQLFGALSVQSLRILIFSGAFSAVGTGLIAALWAYIMNYFWELTSGQTSLILLANFMGALIASSVAHKFLTRKEKKRTAIELLVLAILIGALPIVLRFAGYFPANGTDLLFVLLFGHGIIQVALSVWLYSISASMTADIVEQGFAKTGYQSEGIILATTTFVSKAGTAGGLISAGLVLSFAAFPDQAALTDVPQEARDMLALLYIAVTSLIYLLATVILSRYAITQSDHAAAVGQLSEAEGK